jgi:hypothetical protein
MIPIAVSDEVLSDGTFAQRLVAEYPPVSDADQLAAALRHVRTGVVSYTVPAGIDHLGRSRERLRGAIAEQLRANA